MSILEKLAGMGDLMIDDPRVIEVLRNYDEDQYPHSEHPVAILLYVDKCMYGSISNLYHCVTLHIGDETLISNHGPIWKTAVNVQSSCVCNCDKSLYSYDKELITVNELFYPKYRSLSDLLLEVDDVMDSEEFVNQISMYVFIYFNVKESEVAEINFRSYDVQPTLTFGYIISNKYIAIVDSCCSYYDHERGSSQRINIFYRSIELESTVKDLYDNEDLNMGCIDRALAKYKNDLCCEPITFRQFLGFHSIKSARNV